MWRRVAPSTWPWLRAEVAYVLAGYAVTLATLLLYALRIMARERSLRRDRDGVLS